jgi:lipid A disaccharide synthetase
MSSRVIISQNPHIKELGAVLLNSRAGSIMMMRNDLREAYNQMESRGQRFESALINAQQEAENALSQITGYDPTDSTLLRSVRSRPENYCIRTCSFAKKRWNREG